MAILLFTAALVPGVPTSRGQGPPCPAYDESPGEIQEVAAETCVLPCDLNVGECALNGVPQELDLCANGVGQVAPSVCEATLGDDGLEAAGKKVVHAKVWSCEDFRVTQGEYGDCASFAANGMSAEVWTKDGLHCGDGYYFYSADLRKWEWNDMIRSAAARDDCGRVTLWEHINFKGRTLNCVPDCANMGGFGEEASAIAEYFS